MLPCPIMVRLLNSHGVSIFAPVFFFYKCNSVAKRHMSVSLRVEREPFLFKHESFALFSSSLPDCAGSCTSRIDDDDLTLVLGWFRNLKADTSLTPSPGAHLASAQLNPSAAVPLGVMMMASMRFL